MHSVSLSVLFAFFTVLAILASVGAQPCKGGRSFFFLEEAAKLGLMSEEQMQIQDATCLGDPTTIDANGCETCQALHYAPSKSVCLHTVCTGSAAARNCNCNLRTPANVKWCEANNISFWQGAKNVGKDIWDGVKSVFQSTSIKSGVSAAKEAIANIKAEHSHKAGDGITAGSSLAGAVAASIGVICTSPTQLNCWEAPPTEAGAASFLQTGASPVKSGSPKVVAHCVTVGGKRKCGRFRVAADHPLAKQQAKKKTVGKITSKQNASKQTGPKKAVAKKVAPKKTAPKNTAPTKKVAPRKVAPKKVLTKKAPPKNAIAKKAASKIPAAQQKAGGKTHPGNSSLLTQANRETALAKAATKAGNHATAHDHQQLAAKLMAQYKMSLKRKF